MGQNAATEIEKSILRKMYLDIPQPTISLKVSLNTYAATAKKPLKTSYDTAT